MVITQQNPADGIVCLLIDGRIDTVTAPELEVVVKKVQPAAKTLILDLASVSYVSSAGLRVVMAAQKAAMAQQGKLIIKNVQREVMQVFEMTGFSRILTFE